MMNSYFPAIGEDAEFDNTNNIVDKLLEVKLSFDVPEDERAQFQVYQKTIQMLLKRSLPVDIIEDAESIESLDDFEKISEFYHKIVECVPLTGWTKKLSKAPCTISLTTITPASETQGVGRFLADAYSRWPIPGKQLTLTFVKAIAFEFLLFPGYGFLIHQLIALVENQKDLSILKMNLPILAKEIKLNILAVQHARRIISLMPLTLDQKKLIIQENILSLLDRPGKEIESNLFDHMHHFLIKVSAEKKVTQIKEQIAPLLEYQPKHFERDIFAELQTYVALFHDEFVANREMRHLTRIISYKYLLRKLTTNESLSHPNQRHLYVKLVHSTIIVGHEVKRVVGVIITINILRENELIEERHIYSAVKSILPEVNKVRDSSLIDRRANNNVRSIYLEVYKENGNFSISEIKQLSKRLPREIKTRIESVINPIFMPRNEEEVMKNILILSNQLKYVQDIPQVMINFHKQTSANLSFTIILLRVNKPEDFPLLKLFGKFKSTVTFSEHEVKAVGWVRKKYPKEVNIFEMQLEKKNFLRRDFSVDLNAARRFVYNTLCEMVGEVRDYNGGMISKQSEVLNRLKKLLLQINIQNDFLLENFFYSLAPNYMQSILNPTVLKKLFLILLEAVEHDYSKNIFFLKTQIVDDYFILTLGAINPTIKDFIEQKIEPLEMQPSALTTSFVNIYEVSCLSYILHFNDPDEHQHFLQVVIEAVKVWKEMMNQNISASFFPNVEVK